MKNCIIHREVIITLVLLLWLQPVVGRPKRCSLARNFVIVYPHNSGAKKECRSCPECPEGQGLSPQCGSQISNDTIIECKPCQVNKTYSDSHGIGSCFPCNECGLRNVLQPCTLYQNRKCGKDCPKGYFLNDNEDCQAVATSKATSTNPSVHNDNPSVHNTTKKQLKTQVSNATATSAKHLSVSGTTGTPGLATPTPHPTTNYPTDENRNDDKGHRIKKSTLILILTILALSVIVAAVAIFCCIRSKTESAKQGGTAEETTRLSSFELESDGSTQVEDLREEAELNVEQVPEGCSVSDIELLHDNKNQPMSFYVKRELDPIETVTRKTWKSVGQALGVSPSDLDLIETEYKSGGSPTEILIKKLKTLPKKPTLRDFVQALITCERNDVANYICNFPWEKLKDNKDQLSTVHPTS